MDLFFVVWGGVVGRALIAGLVVGSIAAVVAFRSRRGTTGGRFLASLWGARLSLARAQPGERVMAFGRVDVEGHPAKRFDDGAPCAVSSVETSRGSSVERGAGLVLCTSRGRIPLSGAVSIEATTDSYRSWARSPVGLGGPIRVATLAIGEHALVVGQAERVVDAAASTYRAPALGIAIGASQVPVAVLGTRRLVRTAVAFATRAAAPGVAGSLCVLGGAWVCVCAPSWIDGLGHGERVPAHLALPLLSPVHRAEALAEVDAWVTMDLSSRFDPHLVDLAVALRAEVPNCQRELVLARAVPGGRAAIADDCDGYVGRELIGSPASRSDPAGRAAAWADVMVSVERVQALEALLVGARPRGLTEEDEWERVRSILARRSIGDGLREVVAFHLRRLAVVEAVHGNASVASMLATEARRQHADGAVDAATAALVHGLDLGSSAMREHLDISALARLYSLDPVRSAVVPPWGERGVDAYLDIGVDAASLFERGDRPAATVRLARFIPPGLLPATRTPALDQVIRRQGPTRVADAR